MVKTNNMVKTKEAKKRNMVKSKAGPINRLRIGLFWEITL